MKNQNQVLQKDFFKNNKQTKIIILNKQSVLQNKISSNPLFTKTLRNEMIVMMKVIEDIRILIKSLSIMNLQEEFTKNSHDIKKLQHIIKRAYETKKSKAKNTSMKTLDQFIARIQTIQALRR